jgi:hypothetical protein
MRETHDLHFSVLRGVLHFSVLRGVCGLSFSGSMYFCFVKNYSNMILDNN